MRLSASIEALATLNPDVRDPLFGTDLASLVGHAQPRRPRYLLVDPPSRQTLAQGMPKIISASRTDSGKGRQISCHLPVQQTRCAERSAAG